MAIETTITWNPSPTSTTDQIVQYRVKQEPPAAWINQATVGPAVNTYTFQGLLANQIYEFRVVGNRDGGGVVASILDSQIALTCPVPSITNQPTLVAYSFAHLGGNVTKYVVHLLDVNNNAVLGKVNEHTNLSGTIEGQFDGLTPSTIHKIRITVYSGTEFAKTCDPVAANTVAAATCSAPTNVVATMVEVQS